MRADIFEEFTKLITNSKEVLLTELESVVLGEKKCKEQKRKDEESQEEETDQGTTDKKRRIEELF